MRPPLQLMRILGVRLPLSRPNALPNPQIEKGEMGEFVDSQHFVLEASHAQLAEGPIIRCLPRNHAQIYESLEAQIQLHATRHYEGKGYFGTAIVDGFEPDPDGVGCSSPSARSSSLHKASPPSTKEPRAKRPHSTRRESWRSAFTPMVCGQSQK